MAAASGDSARPAAPPTSPSGGLELVRVGDDSVDATPAGRVGDDDEVGGHLVAAPPERRRSEATRSGGGREEVGGHSRAMAEGRW